MVRRKSGKVGATFARVKRFECVLAIAGANLGGTAGEVLSHLDWGNFFVPNNRTVFGRKCFLSPPPAAWKRGESFNSIAK